MFHNVSFNFATAISKFDTFSSYHIVRARIAKVTNFFPFCTIGISMYQKRILPYFIIPSTFSPQASSPLYQRQDFKTFGTTQQHNRITSLPGLLGRASFRLELNLARKTEQVKKKVTKIRPPPFAAEIDPLLSRDGNALRPDASAHCRLATCHSVWSGGSSVASGGLSFK